jgi:hypothetical protein
VRVPEGFKISNIPRDLHTIRLTNHQDTSGETLGGESAPANFRSDLPNRLATVCLFTHLRDKRVSGVRDDGADNTSNVTGGEGDTELSGFAVAILGLSEDVLVEELNGLLEEEELGHGVGDLTRPEGDEGTEGVAGLNRLCAHLLESSAEGNGESTGGRGLDLDLCHFKRAKSDVGEDLSRGGTSKPDEGLVLLGGLLASQVRVGILEDLIETVLEHALEGVTDESWAKTFPETLGALLSREELEGLTKALVLAGVDL